MRVFVTGGAGYVGSHCIRELLAQGHEVVTYDDLSQGHRAALPDGVPLIEGRLGDASRLKAALSDARFDAVMHFAAYALVGDSVRMPLEYYRNNVAQTLTLLECMRDLNIRRLVFSSTCATYGEPREVPIREDHPQSPINPYGRSKLAVEWMLRDSAVAWGLGSCSLRYFNACGAAGDGTIGEDHTPETHLIPLVLQVALGQRPSIPIYGTDYPTPDGTCIRDYVHVEDLASAHCLAIEAVPPAQAWAFNLGTGRGHSVREIVETARRVTGRSITVTEEPRRPGDPPELIADASLARQRLGWSARWTDIQAVIASAWRWHSTHPSGYASRKA